MYQVLDAKQLDTTKAGCVTGPNQQCLLGILNGIGCLGKILDWNKHWG